MFSVLSDEVGVAVGVFAVVEFCPGTSLVWLCCLTATEEEVEEAEVVLDERNWWETTELAVAATATVADDEADWDDGDDWSRLDVTEEEGDFNGSERLVDIFSWIKED